MARMESCSRISQRKVEGKDWNKGSLMAWTESLEQELFNIFQLNNLSLIE